MKRIPPVLFFLAVSFFLVFLNGCGSSQEKPSLPELRVLSPSQAAELIPYVRKLKTVVNNGNPRPNAWALVNASCQDRAIALEYAFAAATDPPGAEPPAMRDSDLTPEKIMALAENPRYDVATLNVTGPLAALQTYVLPYGNPVTESSEKNYWAYHHAVAINIEGEIKVVDLSAGDEPLTIDEWVHSFVVSSIECIHMNADDFHDLWVYWNSAFTGFEPGKRPQKLCGYTFTKMFSFREDQTPEDLADFIRSVPSTMQVQLDALANTLNQNYGINLPEDQLPLVTSTYVPQTEADICTWVYMPFCHTL